MQQVQDVARRTACPAAPVLLSSRHARRAPPPPELAEGLRSQQTPEAVESALEALSRLPPVGQGSEPSTPSDILAPLSPLGSDSAGSSSDATPCSSSSTSGAGSQRGRWVDSSSCHALCLLILDDRRGSACERGPQQRRALPPFLYAENVAPFLRFDEPLPNMLYAFGGRNQSHGPLDTVEMLDTWHGTWVTCDPMPTRRAGSAAALLPDGRLAVIGGYNEKGIAEGLLATCDVYSPFTQCWEKSGMASLLRARWGHGCASMGGKVYVAGGCSLLPDAQPREAFMETLKTCEVYDAATNLWSPCAPLQIARSGFRIVALDGGRFLAAVGGCDNVFGRAETQNTVELYDSTSGAWSLLDARLRQPRTTAAAVAIGGRDILVMGGAPSLSTTEMYRVSAPGPCADQDAGSSTDSREAASMAEGRMGCQAVVLPLPRRGESFPVTCRPSVMIVGGERCEEMGGDLPRVRQFATVPVYDIETGEWREDGIVPPMAAPRTAVAICVGRGRVVP